MGDDNKDYTITIGNETYTTYGPISTNTGTVTIDTTTPSTLTYDSSISPTFTISGVDSSPEWEFGDLDNLTNVSVDTELVESNPTCKALWDQFLYVYEMIKSDKENHEEKDDISF
jgi:hypothetical protein